MRARLSISSFFCSMASIAIALNILRFEIARGFTGMPIGWAKSLAAQHLQDAQCFFDATAHIGVTYN